MRSNLTEILCEMMGEMPRPVTIHVCDGRLTDHHLDANAFQETVAVIARCRFVYVLDGIRGRVEPIAAFVANETIGRGQLRYLIDGRPPAAAGNLPRHTTDKLGVYFRSRFADNGWLRAVTVPGHVNALDGLFGLCVTDGESSTVSLRDAGHRPLSSRTMAQPSGQPETPKSCAFED
ncbi:hypothetical protein [Aporhodopirellula aestuarii]|uniref:Transposase n=1 Tax=Aporhodopirellula aestuarii TaxID=2950107 RepID=A0ABT0TX91_9BACT|nr:hypothetical protein [Aporhodopirellula aestuarii]MCM2369211.1 hypothetical protein [Aporhodopirellula aestuarii]